MTPSESNQNLEENQLAAESTVAGNDGPGGTAPDSETQSSAASSGGDRTTEEGSRATEDPAEGRDEE